ncbi:hypothetical protein [Kineosporia sp. NBRC 101731]|uniref:hypothetical protein n=1 Tax=Kineosporia sp. NBRC 101731 TaxID=3032199 RepID=UPI0024A53041|nr:hypothetical protein [Kineosporia sp. NBRC 101731]GLY30768.1 hypothetical protein Kisp02_41330 [Kineosporia sp. NBRC 101731]
MGAAYGPDTTAIPAVIANVMAANGFGAQIALVGVAGPDAAIPRSSMLLRQEGSRPVAADVMDAGSGQCVNHRLLTSCSCC